MAKYGVQVKYGYILKDNITLEDYVLSFYKSINLGRRVDNDLSIDPFNRCYLRVEIPPDMKTIIHVDDENDHITYMVVNGYQKKVKDLNPAVVYRTNVGFRPDKKLTRYYNENPDIDVTKVFHNEIKFTGKGRKREM